MSGIVNDFMNLFNLNELINAETMTLLDFLKAYVEVFIAVAFVLVTFRFIMEFIKIFLDWGRFK